MQVWTKVIGVGRFRILGGGGGGKLWIFGRGAKGGGQIPSRHSTSLRRRCDVTTSHPRHFDRICAHKVFNKSMFLSSEMEQIYICSFQHL